MGAGEDATRRPGMCTQSPLRAAEAANPGDNGPEDHVHLEESVVVDVLADVVEVVVLA